MTFYEAALRILEGAGHPLLAAEITQQAVAKSFLSHVGKTPEQTMLSRLAAMARRPRDRRVVVTAKDTFALVEWGLPEDAAALAMTGVALVNPEEALPPLRAVERHPDPRPENARAVGRGDRKRRHDRDDDDRGKRRRFPPISEVAFEILSEGPGGLKPEELAARAVERELAGEGLGTEQILLALAEDNQRRIDAGRRPQFILDQATGALALERPAEPGGAPQLPPSDLQGVFAAALNLPMEGGRLVTPRTAERAGERTGERAIEPTGDAQAAQTAKVAAKDARRAMARVLRKKLGDLDGATLEKAVVRMLHALGFRDFKVARRSKEGPLMVARKREGSAELRYAVKVARAAVPVDRRAVQELRRGLGAMGAQVGILASPGDVRGDARAEAQGQGSLVMLWCSEGLAEKFFEARTGVSVQTVELFEIDERFFDQARVDGDEASQRREERHREHERAEPDRPAAGEVPAEAAGAVSEGAQPAEAAVAAERTEGAVELGEVEAERWADDDEGEGDDAEGEVSEVTVGQAPLVSNGRPGELGQPGLPGSGKRRRRRRRGRRGRGPRPGEPMSAGSGQGQGASSAAPVAGASAEPVAPPPPVAGPAPSSGGEGQ